MTAISTELPVHTRPEKDKKPTTLHWTTLVTAFAFVDVEILLLVFLFRNTNTECKFLIRDGKPLTQECKDMGTAEQKAMAVLFLVILNLFGIIWSCTQVFGPKFNWDDDKTFAYCVGYWVLLISSILIFIFQCLAMCKLAT